MGDSEAMVAEGYTSAPYGDYNVSAATVTVESTGQENVVNQSNALSVDSSQSLNNASLVNGTGPVGSLSAPVENGNATEHRDKLGSTLSPAYCYGLETNGLDYISCIDSLASDTTTHQPQIRNLSSVYEASTQKKKKSTSHRRVRSLASLDDSAFLHLLIQRSEFCILIQIQNNLPVHAKISSEIWIQ
ncbi:unnamed protein product [Arabis nemorensis]|uniref:Uncharacterized protein n=1 Tax=Arabis nemorensis TaxID=586526 RepID=A0A565AKK6_9BRAS|nr:unnamed protein product [Arabis nemorensis]